MSLQIPALRIPASTISVAGSGNHAGSRSAKRSSMASTEASCRKKTVSRGFRRSISLTVSAIPYG